MAKKQLYLDPNTGTPTDKQVPGAIPLDMATGTPMEKPGSGGDFRVNFTTDWHGLGDLFGGKGAPPSPFSSGSSGGGGSDPKGPNLNTDIMIRSELQRQFPGAPINDEMVQYIKGQLTSKGLDDNAKAKDYRSAIDQWVQGNPSAQSYFSQYTPFGAPAQAGQLSPAALAQMLQLSNSFTAPLAKEIQASGDAAGTLLSQALPNLPASMKGIVGAYAGGQGIYHDLAQQMAAAVTGAQPGEIANAASKYYQSPTGTATTSLAGLQALTGKSS